MKVSFNGNSFTEMLQKSGVFEDSVPWYVSGLCLCIYMIFNVLQAVVAIVFVLINALLIICGSIVFFLIGLLIFALSPFKILIDKFGRKSE